MDNADRRNIHARAACPKAGMDRQAPSPKGTMASVCQRSFADRDARPCGSFRRAFPAWPCNIPSSRTRHPRIRTRAADARPDCMALPRIARPQPGGEPRRIVVAFRPKARRRRASAPPRGLRRLHHPAPGGTPRDRAGRFRVTVAPLWAQAVVAPAVQAFHAVFPEVELKLRTAAWARGRPAARGRPVARQAAVRPARLAAWNAAPAPAARLRPPPLPLRHTRPGLG